MPDLHECVQQPEPKSSCSRHIVDQPKVSAGKESAGGDQGGEQVPEGFVVPSYRGALYLKVTLQPRQRFQILLLSSPAWAVVHETLQRLIELLNLQWLLQNRDRTDLKNSIEDLAIWVTCDHDNVEVRINLLGCFIHLITRSIRQLQVQKHEIEFLLTEAEIRSHVFGLAIA